MKFHLNESSLTYIGIYLLSFSTLLFEISLTRVFSIAQWYHFAFMVVSMALLGYGASGSFLMLFPSILKKDAHSVLSNGALLFSISSLVSYILTNIIAFDPVKIAWDPLQIVYIFIYYLLLSIPFFFSGMTISSAIYRFGGRVHRIYFSDLLGAGSGCLSALIIFFLLGASKAIAAAAISGILASAVFYAAKIPRPLLNNPSTILPLNKGRRRVGLFPYRLFLIIIPLSLIIFSPSFMEINISPYKGLPAALRYPDAEKIETRWDSFSRIDAVKSGAVRFAPGLSLKFQERLPEQIGLTIDGGSLNAITKFSGNREEMAFTDYLPSSISYYLTEHKDALIFDPRGGLDVLSAIYHNAQNIETIEFYPLINDIVKNDYGDFSGGIYGRSDVRAKIGDARAFIRASKKSYDIIQISPQDILAASSSGIYGLTEDYRFTVEAFKDYIGHIAENGVLSITLYLIPPPRHELRIIGMALKALKEIGVPTPENHISVIRTWGTITIIIKRSELSHSDIKKIKEFCKERHFDIEYYHGISSEETNIYNRFQEPLYFNLIMKIVDSQERERFLKDYLFDITPATDDRPFFHHFFKWDRIRDTYNIFGEKWQPFLEGGYIIPAVFIQALIASIIFIVLPIFFSNPFIPPLKKGGKGGFSFLLYFFFIGIGFMFAEISMIQVFILYLGHPVYSISTVLFTILISSGVGSYVSGKYLKGQGARGKGQGFKICLLVLCGVIVIYALFLPYILDNLPTPSFVKEGQGGIIWRQAISFILLFPMGFLMGMPFPTGIKILTSPSSPHSEGGDRGGWLIPWAWCVNGCSSVTSSILIILIALSFGFKTALILSAAAYACAFFIFSLISHNSRLYL
jgi:hypothetical protein